MEENSKTEYVRLFTTLGIFVVGFVGGVLTHKWFYGGKLSAYFISNITDNIIFFTIFMNLKLFKY